MGSAHLRRLKAEHIVAILRFRPFDTTTAEGRAQERYRRIVLTATASGLAKVVSVLATIITIPLMVRYLGAERYGMWATISSITALLSFADLGMGNGLLNVISGAHGKDDRYVAQQYVSSAFFLLIGFALLLTLIFAVTYSMISWPRIFNVASPPAVAEAGLAAAVFIGCFLINLPLGIIHRIQLGYQEGFANSLWLAVGNILAVCGVLLAVYLEAGLPWLVLSLTGGPLAALFINGIVLFGYRRPWLQPKLKLFTPSAAIKIFRIGFLFLVLQLAVAMAYTSDNIIIAQSLGSEAVTQYAVPYRLFTIIPLLLVMIVRPMWPAYGEAVARQDIKWIQETLSLTLKLTIVVVGLPTVALVVFGQEILKLWVGSPLGSSIGLLLGLGIWALLSSVGNTLAMFLNGANIIRFQVVTAILMAFTALIAKIFLIRAVGISGVIWATIFSYTIFVMLPSIIYVPRLLKRLEVAPREFLA
jgi:O-antigen/teichoic acid export membrane protein